MKRNRSRKRLIKNVFITTEKMTKRRSMPLLPKGEFRISGIHIGHGHFTSGRVWRIRVNPKTNEMKFYSNDLIWTWKVPWSMLPL